MDFILNLFYLWNIVIWLRNTDYFLFSFFFSFHEEVAALGDAMLDSVTRFSQLPTVMILCFCTRSSQLVCALEQECLNTVPHNPGI